MSVNSVQSGNSSSLAASASLRNEALGHRSIASISVSSNTASEGGDRAPTISRINSVTSRGLTRLEEGGERTSSLEEGSLSSRVQVAACPDATAVAETGDLDSIGSDRLAIGRRATNFPESRYNHLFLMSPTTRAVRQVFPGQGGGAIHTPSQVWRQGYWERRTLAPFVGVSSSTASGGGDRAPTISQISSVTSQDLTRLEQGGERTSSEEEGSLSSRVQVAACPDATAVAETGDLDSISSGRLTISQRGSITSEGQGRAVAASGILASAAYGGGSSSQIVASAEDTRTIKTSSVVKDLLSLREAQINTSEEEEDLNSISSEESLVYVEVRSAAPKRKCNNNSSQKVKKAYNDLLPGNRTLKNLMRNTGLSATSVRRYCKEIELKLDDGRGGPEKTKAKIRAAYNSLPEGKRTVTAIARETGLSAKTVRKYYKGMGLKLDNARGDPEKTKAKIRAAYNNLPKGKRTVTAIAKLAKIDRATVYKYSEDMGLKLDNACGDPEKTKAKIRAAYDSLREGKRTVTAIAKLAKIDRATVYKYSEDMGLKLDNAYGDREKTKAKIRAAYNRGIHTLRGLEEATGFSSFTVRQYVAIMELKVDDFKVSLQAQAIQEKIRKAYDSLPQGQRTLKNLADLVGKSTSAVRMHCNRMKLKFDTGTSQRQLVLQAYKSLPVKKRTIGEMLKILEMSEPDIREICRSMRLAIRG